MIPKKSYKLLKHLSKTANAQLNVQLLSPRFPPLVQNLVCYTVYTNTDRTGGDTLDSQIAQTAQPAPTKTELLSVQDVWKTFTGEKFEIDALKGVSLDLHEGEFLAIMGTSGSGKSTLLNIIGALEEPDHGSICIYGEDNHHMFAEPYATEFRRDNIGFIFQSFHLLTDLSVEENIALPLILKGLRTDEIKQRTDEILRFTQLERWKRQLPHKLSGGQQQRVAIGRALITHPPIILADEPTGNLDLNTSTEILEMLVAMKEQMNQSIIMVTHDPTVAAYADRILFFHDGEVKDACTCQGTPDDIENIFNKFKHLVEGDVEATA